MSSTSSSQIWVDHEYKSVVVVRRFGNYKWVRRRAIYYTIGVGNNNDLIKGVLFWRRLLVFLSPSPPSPENWDGRGRPCVINVSDNIII